MRACLTSVTNTLTFSILKKNMKNIRAINSVQVMQVWSNNKIPYENLLEIVGRGRGSQSLI